jgi:PIN domain nuclease of toxin-antitoxin system
LILLDAYALIALALDEPVAAEVDALLRERANDAAATSANLAEVVDFLVRQANWPEADVQLELTLLLQTTLGVVDLTAETALRAGLLRARHYVRRHCDVSLADCVLLTSAGQGDAVATADPAVASVARAEGIGLVALPDSSGRRP